GLVREVARYRTIFGRRLAVIGPRPSRVERVEAALLIADEAWGRPALAPEDRHDHGVCEHGAAVVDQVGAESEAYAEVLCIPGLELVTVIGLLDLGLRRGG